MMEPAEDLLEGIRTLLRAFTVNESRFPPAEGRIKYNAVDFQSLYYVAEHPGCRAVDLAAHLGVAATTVQSVVERMIRRGFVERQPSEDSRRAVALTLSPEGEAVVAAIRRQDLANCGTMLEALPPAARARFAAEVRLIATRIEEDRQHDR